MNEELESRDVSRAAARMALTETREEENTLKQMLAEEQILCGAVDFGGDFTQSVMKIVERTVVCAKREGLIGETHHEEGAVAGAAHESVMQISSKAMGLNVGGKIGIARSGEHIAVCVFFGVGLGHLNEVCIGMGHRTI